jgi:uncharacterized protein
MRQNPATWFEIYVQDMSRAKMFYESVLQLKLAQLKTPEEIGEPTMELWSFPMAMDRMGIGGALVKMEGFPSGRNSTLIYFACTDCAVEEARVTQFGGRIQRGKTAIGEYGFISLAFDTEGNMFGLHSME